MRPAAPQPLPFVAALAAILAGAFALTLSFPERGWWWAAPIGVALNLLAIRGQRPGIAAYLGFLGGLAFYLMHVAWTSLFLGAVPWTALSALMALWWMLGSIGIAIAYRRLPTRPGRTRSLGALPVAVASLWTLRETLASNVPYGGFAWGRIAQSQSNSPLLELVSWVGFAGVAFLVVWFVAFTIEVVLHPRDAQVSPRPRAGFILRRAAQFTGVAAAGAALLVWPLWPTQQGETVRILAVQGDTPGASYFIPSDPGEILESHAQVTLDALEKAGQVDLVLWPEGSVDVSPLLNSYSADLISYVEQRAGAPVLMNTVTMTGDWDDPDTQYFNSQIVWHDGEAGEQYDKAHPIPFGEYVPDREVFEALAPDLIGMIQREYTPGIRSNVLDIDGTRYGVFICYDIVDDNLVREAVAGDAGVLLAPTNNADFGYSEESAQQLATARLRAVESGRPLVQASTVGWSAAFAADGTQIAGLDWYEPGAFVAEVTTGVGETPATVFGDAIDLLAGGVGLAIVVAAPRRRD